MQAIEEVIARWDSGEDKPFKGSLIDWDAYQADPTSVGCMCAQGQVLHLSAGWSPERLRDTDQEAADKATAELLGISVAHAILLRSINDKADGAPSIVLTDPAKVLGDQAHVILAFWRHLDRMTEEDWNAAWVAARVAARVATRDAARDAAWDAAWVAARVAAWDAARDAAWDAARDAAWDAAWVAARVAAWDAADAAAYAVTEIMGARVLRERGEPFFFLPMFGFADPEAVSAADMLAGA